MSPLFKCVQLAPSAAQPAEHPSGIESGERGTAGFIKSHGQRASVLTQEHLVEDTL